MEKRNWVEAGVTFLVGGVSGPLEVKAKCSPYQLIEDITYMLL